MRTPSFSENFWWTKIVNERVFSVSSNPQKPPRNEDLEIAADLIPPAEQSDSKQPLTRHVYTNVQSTAMSLEVNWCFTNWRCNSSDAANTFVLD